MIEYEHITLEEVEQAYYECRRAKRTHDSALQYELNYEMNNYRLWRDLNSQTYEIGRSICFVVTRPKLREVFAANFRDRIVHHIIIRRFMPLFEQYMIDDSYNCRRGKGTYYGVNRLSGFINSAPADAWVLKCDISAFFMSIDKDALLGIVLNVIDGTDDAEWWKWLITKVITNSPEKNCERRGDARLWDRLDRRKSLFYSGGRGLPIGNLTSQIFANLYLTVFDLLVLLLFRDVRYGRYVDDFFMIGDRTTLLRFIGMAKEFLSVCLHVTMHPDKIYLQHISKGVSFVGGVVKPGRRYIGNRTVANFYRCVDEWNSGRYDDWQMFVSRYNSYNGFLRQYDSYAIRRRVWNRLRRKDRIYMCGHYDYVKLIKSKKQ